MLGISGSGKTSYMAGLAQKMSSIGVGGFTISPAGSDAAASAIERSKFAKLMFSNNDFDFPPGTTNTTNWVFSLAKHGVGSVFFEWVDFRGGFIDQIYTGVDDGARTDIEEFLRYAQASDAILIFVDAVRLYRTQGNRGAFERLTRLPALFQYLIDFSAQESSRVNRTLVVVNTKADSDLLPQSLQSNNFQQLNELSRRELASYIDPLHQFGWRVAICSTGAVGVGCVKSTEEPAKSFREAPRVSVEITADPNPANVETPLLFCLLQEIRKLTALATSSVHHREYVRQQIERESRLLDFLKVALQNSPTIRERIANLDTKLAEDRGLLASFQRLIPELEGLLRGKMLLISV